MRRSSRDLNQALYKRSLHYLVQVLVKRNREDPGFLPKTSLHDLAPLVTRKFLRIRVRPSPAQVPLSRSCGGPGDDVRASLRTGPPKGSCGDRAKVVARPCEKMFLKSYCNHSSNSCIIWHRSCEKILWRYMGFLVKSCLA